MALTVRISAGNPAGLDSLSIDALVLPAYELCAQPQGVAGYVDWRLCGRLGKLLKSRRFSGRFGEHVLMSTLGRISPKRIFLIGLGEPKSCDAARHEEMISRVFAVTKEALVDDFAIAPPELPASRVKEAPVSAPEKIAALWLSASICKTASAALMVLLDAGGLLERARKDLIEAGAKNGINWGSTEAERELRRRLPEERPGRQA